MRKYIAILMMLMVFAVAPVWAQETVATPEATIEEPCDIQLEAANAKVLSLQNQIAVLNTIIPGKGLIWKIAHWKELEKGSRIALITEIVTYTLLTGAAIYGSVDELK